MNFIYLIYYKGYNTKIISSHPSEIFVSLSYE